MFFVELPPLSVDVMSWLRKRLLVVFPVPFFVPVESPTRLHQRVVLQVFQRRGSRCSPNNAHQQRQREPVPKEASVKANYRPSVSKHAHRKSALLHSNDFAPRQSGKFGEFRLREATIHTLSAFFSMNEVSWPSYTQSAQAHNAESP